MLTPILPKELFPGDAFVNHLFRSLQYRIAVEAEPEFAPKILEIWEAETKPHQPHQSYLLLSRNAGNPGVDILSSVTCPVKQMVGYLKEFIDITDSDKSLFEKSFWAKLFARKPSFFFKTRFLPQSRKAYTISNTYYHYIQQTVSDQ